ncbi:hypothetical protein OIU79_002263 [Salix purpurea]|uniref:Uncharacterized protein n=1 Tax=Salix purpurea TaxID=77065 RepID=A0A9Q0USA9_SALPP|nr:hypothetical protein OIU79_002263 [Salix purpurea]
MKKKKMKMSMALTMMKEKVHKGRRFREVQLMELHRRRNHSLAPTSCHMCFPCYSLLLDQLLLVVIMSQVPCFGPVQT